MLRGRPDVAALRVEDHRDGRDVRGCAPSALRVRLRGSPRSTHLRLNAQTSRLCARRSAQNSKIASAVRAPLGNRFGSGSRPTQERVVVLPAAELLDEGHGRVRFARDCSARRIQDCASGAKRFRGRRAPSRSKGTLDGARAETSASTPTRPSPCPGEGSTKKTKPRRSGLSHQDGNGRPGSPVRTFHVQI